MESYYKQYCLSLKETNRYRKLFRDEVTDGLDFSSNDYLQLSKHPLVLKAAYEAGEKYGVGSTGARLLSGNNEMFEDFEGQIAKDKKTEAALIFSSGFQANVSVLSTLLDKSVLKERPLVFFDRHNHSSLYQAVFLSNPEMLRYRHNDMQHLEELLKKSDPNRQKFIVAETVFSMDGDVLPIYEIKDLAKKHNAFLYLDEAHATGMFGENGYGLSTDVDFCDVEHLIMGTFSKALGCQGAYIACSDVMREYLINKSPGFIYSTAPSPIIIGAARQAWQMIPSLTREREKILLLAEYLRKSLMEIGLEIGVSSSQIIPVIIGDEKVVLEMKETLLRSGVAVSAIRPPTAPVGMSALRITLTSSHIKEHLEYLISRVYEMKIM